MRKKSSHSSHFSVSPSSFFLLPFSLFNRTYADTLDLGCRKIAIASNSFPSLALFPSPQKIQPPSRLKSDPDRSPAIANMPPIALSVAVVDRLLDPGLVPVGVPASACSSPSATNSPGYATSATIAESDFYSCRTIGAIVLL